MRTSTPRESGHKRRTIAWLVVCAALAMLAGLAPHRALSQVDPTAAPEGRRNALEFGEGLLWKIADGGVPPSFIFGTIHAADARVKRLPAAVRKAFNDSDVFVMEVVPDAALSEKMRQAMVFSDGHSLKDTVNDRVYDAAVRALAKYNITEQVANRLKPWAIASTLSVPENKTGTPLDQWLYEQARVQKKSIFGLETAAEQIAVLNKMSSEDQIDLLRGALDTFEDRYKIYDTLLQDYLDRDIAAIFLLNDKYAQGDKRLAATVEQRIILDRNARMVKRMLPQLKQGRAFIAIGAGHLPGHDGVLGQLQRQGYTVSRAY
jgi:uncharacterized protein YbaP (TraB family)